MHVLLTRPQAQSQAFAAQIASRFAGVAQVTISPTMRIEPVPFHVDFDAFDAVVFTSRNGVAAYEAAQGPAGKYAYCVGRRTAQAAQAIGLTPNWSEGGVAALNALLAEKASGQTLLHLSGAHLAGQVDGNVTRVVAYRQTPKALSPEATDLLIGDVAIVVPFFSANSVTWFQDAMPAGVSAKLHALCLSPAVSSHLLRPCYADVAICETPTAEAMLDQISGRIGM